MPTINQHGTIPKPLPSQPVIPLHYERLSGKRQPTEHSSAYENSDSIYCGCLSSFAVLKNIPQKASNLWDRIWNRTNTNPESRVVDRNEEHFVRHTMLSKNETTIPESLTVPKEEVHPTITEQGVVNSSSIETRDSNDPSNKIDPSDLISLKESDFDENLHKKLTREIRSEDLDKIVDTADVNSHNKRTFILKQNVLSEYVFERLLENPSPDERLEIFEHKNLPDAVIARHAKRSNDAERELMLKNQNLCQAGMLSLMEDASYEELIKILKREEATELVYSRFLLHNPPKSITNEARLAIALSTKAGTSNLQKLCEGLPQINHPQDILPDDELEVMTAMLKNLSIGGKAARSILKHVPSKKLMEILNDKKTTPGMIHFITQVIIERKCVAEMERKDFNLEEYRSERMEIIKNKKTGYRSLDSLVPDANNAEKPLLIEHDNAEESFVLSALAEKASENECVAIWKRIEKIGGLCWSTWKALRGNPTCPQWILNKIDFEFAKERVDLEARVLGASAAELLRSHSHCINETRESSGLQASEASKSAEKIILMEAETASKDKCVAIWKHTMKTHPPCWEIWNKLRDNDACPNWIHNQIDYALAKERVRLDDAAFAASGGEALTPASAKAS